jgi:hypothetical protein
VEPISSWEEDRKFVLRAWCLVFIILATAMLLSVLDGRMAYLHGAYTGYVGFWTNCKKHTCADLRQVTGQWGDGAGFGALYGVVVFRDDQQRKPLEEPLWVFLIAREIFRILEGLSGNSLKALGGSFLELYAAYEATGVALCLGRRVLHLAKPQSAS